MRLSKLLLSALFLCASISIGFAQYFHVLDSLTKDVKTAYIVRDSAGQAVVINNSSIIDPTIGTGETVGLDIRVGDFNGLGDLAGIRAFGLRSETAADSDISIWGMNGSACGLAGFFQGNTIVERRLDPNFCDLPLKVRMDAKSVFGTPGAPLVGRPSAVPPLTGIPTNSSDLGGLTIFYKDVADIYAPPSGGAGSGMVEVNGDGITLLPFFVAEPTTPPLIVDVPVLGVLNYKEPFGAPTDDPGVKGCPECFTDIAFRNQLFVGGNCNGNVPPPVNGDISKSMANFNKDILDSYRAIEFYDSEIGKKQFFYLIPESLPSYTLNMIGEDIAISGKDWMTHLTLGVKALDEEQQDLQAENEALKERVATLEAKLDKLAELLGKATQLEELSAPQGTLQQNQPNPFNQQTTINYELPDNVNTAQMVIRNLQGQVLKTFSLEAVSSGSVILDASSLQAGTYTYTLVIDGKMMETKQMILTQ